MGDFDLRETADNIRYLEAQGYKEKGLLLQPVVITKLENLNFTNQYSEVKSWSKDNNIRGLIKDDYTLLYRPRECCMVKEVDVENDWREKQQHLWRDKIFMLKQVLCRSRRLMQTDPNLLGF